MGRKKTTEEFKELVFQTVGEDYVVLSEYRSMHHKVKVKHQICGHEYEVNANNFLRGSRCPICANRKKSSKMTTDKFKQAVFDLVGDEYEVLSEYQMSHLKIKMKHQACGHEYEVSPHGFLNGYRCPSCRKENSRIKFLERFRSEVFELVGEEYLVLSEPAKGRLKLKFKHQTCGHEFEAMVPDFVTGRKRCPKCRVNKGKWTTEQFKSKVWALTGLEYTVVSEYQHSKSHIKLRHQTCGREYEVQPNSFISGSRCPHCAVRKSKKSTQQFKQEVFNLVGHNYEVLSEYQGATVKIQMKHQECGHEYPVTPTCFLGGTRCPKCNKGGRRKKVVS